MLRILLGKTVVPVSAGIAFMLLGIIIVHATLLPRIYVCPSGASCRHSWDPSSDVLQYLQALMVYWLQLGSIISGFGLFKLVSYQSWLVLKKEGSQIGVLQNNMRALEGNILSAAKLLIRRHNRSLALFAIAPVAIATAIPLLVSRSIITDSNAGQVRLEFSYPTNVTLPRYSETENVKGHRVALTLLDAWLLGEDWSRRLPEVFQGTLTIRDSRVASAVGALPSGLRVVGSVYCGAESLSISNSTSNIDGRIYRNVTYRLPSYFPFPNGTILTDSSTRLGVFPLGAPQLTEDAEIKFSYLWASNVTGWVPNAKTTSDGLVHVSVCNHTISMSNFSDVGYSPIVQLINPSLAVPAKGDSVLTDPSECVANPALCPPRSLYELLVIWWHGRFTDYTFSDPEFSPLSCTKGKLSPFPDNDEPCGLDNKTWTSTVVALSDAMVETGRKSGNSTQSLMVRTTSLNRRKWWFQSLLPFSTLVLYVVCLAFTAYRGRGYETVQELTQLEIATAVVDAYSSASHFDRKLNPGTVVGGT